MRDNDRMTYDTELDVAQDAARRAGEILLRYREQGARYGWKESSRDGFMNYEVVSEADVEVDGALRETLLGAFPGDGWLSEEQHDDPHGPLGRLNRERVWIVDPLDGTREFLQGIPEYAVSIALAVGGRPVLGVVYNPANDEMFAAANGAANERLALDPAGRLGESFMLAGRGEWRFGDLPPVPDGTRLMPVGSIAYRMALLASGTGCLIFTVGRRREWDVAAGAALLDAAGATVTNVYGQPLRFNQAETEVDGLIAARANIHTEARAMWMGSGWRL